MDFYTLLVDYKLKFFIMSKYNTYLFFMFAYYMHSIDFSIFIKFSINVIILYNNKYS